MPWVLLIRVIVRIASALVIWRLVTARRGAYAYGSAPPVQRAPARPHIDGQAIREGVSAGWRAGSLLTLLVAAAVLITAGTALAVLSPRWLGGLLLGVAVLVLVAAVLEARLLWQILAARQRRHHDDELRRLT
jgi:hypothetical protein